MFVLLFLAFAGTAWADPPSNVLVGVHLQLSTTTIALPRSSSWEVVDGVLRTHGLKHPSTVTLPLEVQGYLFRSTFDPPLVVYSTTTPADLGEVNFIPESALVKLKYPRPALIKTLQPWIIIPPNLIKKVQKYKGPYDSYVAYGEPFFIPTDEAALLSEKTPVYSCTVDSERREMDWVSYNSVVSEKELAPICASGEFNADKVRPFVLKGKVFAVVYPAD